MASVGIWSLGANATVTNSGTVIGTLTAFRFFETGATLNLLAGSAIQGSIQFAYDTSATLNIGPGLNTALTFQGLPGTINTFGAPMVVQGPLLAVVDPTGFSAQDEMLTDLTRTIANAVDGRINAARFGSTPATPVLSYAEAGGGADAQTMAFGYPAGAAGAASPGYGFWAVGIGSYRDQDADGADVGFDTGLGGLLVGLDGELANGTRVGAFLGASASRFETDGNSQEIDADSYFGGVYGSYSGQNYFLDASLTGGVTSQSSDRTVANNLVIGGIEHAEADYDGVFVSPSATIGTTYAMSGGTLIPSLRARYAGLFLDGYEEHGSAADMTVDDRDVNVFDFRAQLAYALAARPLNGGVLHTAFRFGADATFADNDDVEAVLLGTGLNFSVSGDDTLRGFAGLDLSWRAAGGADFFLGAEAGYDSGDAFTLDVQGGLRIPL
jgi:outer membrane autotransporter protein